ncbi:hypothetical protein FPHOBKDP_00186 [Listeria phage LPJP1]|nr:hypothetical protein FPHOBKDP_00186 [Listeria phage LPJP1]
MDNYMNKKYNEYLGNERKFTDNALMLDNNEYIPFDNSPSEDKCKLEVTLIIDRVIGSAKDRLSKIALIDSHDNSRIFGIDYNDEKMEVSEFTSNFEKKLKNIDMFTEVIEFPIYYDKNNINIIDQFNTFSDKIKDYNQYLDNDLIIRSAEGNKTTIREIQLVSVFMTIMRTYGIELFKLRDSESKLYPSIKLDQLISHPSLLSITKYTRSGIVRYPLSSLYKRVISIDEDSVIDITKIDFNDYIMDIIFRNDINNKEDIIKYIESILNDNNRSYNSSIKMSLFNIIKYSDTLTDYHKLNSNVINTIIYLILRNIQPFTKLMIMGLYNEKNKELIDYISLPYYKENDSYVLFNYYPEFGYPESIRLSNTSQIREISSNYLSKLYTDKYDNRDLDGLKIIEFSIDKFPFKDKNIKKYDISEDNSINLFKILSVYYMDTKDNLNESVELNEEVSNNKQKRNKIQKYIIDVFNKLDKTGSNAKKYKDIYDKMSDEQFLSYMKKFTNGDDNFYLEVLPNKNEPKLIDIKETLDFMNVPLEEYIYYRHDGNKDNPLRTRYPVPLGYLPVRRLRAKRYAERYVKILRIA